MKAKVYNLTENHQDYKISPHPMIHSKNKQLAVNFAYFMFQTNLKQGSFSMKTSEPGTRSVDFGTGPSTALNLELANWMKILFVFEYFYRTKLNQSTFIFSSFSRLTTFSLLSK